MNNREGRSNKSHRISVTSNFWQGELILTVSEWAMKSENYESFLTTIVATANKQKGTNMYWKQLEKPGTFQWQIIDDPELKESAPKANEPNGLVALGEPLFVKPVPDRPAPKAEPGHIWVWDFVLDPGDRGELGYGKMDWVKVPIKQVEGEPIGAESSPPVV